jgi:hypothetical protein
MIPDWLVLFLVADLFVILFLVLRWVKRRQTIVRSTTLPSNPGPTFVESDYMSRFPESRFEN